MDERGGDGVVGAIGQVTTRIRGGSKPGEVLIPYLGGSEPYIAYADAPVETGRSVLVVAHRPGRVLDVTEFDG